MKIGIVSDSHDHIENLQKAIKKLQKENIEALIHCGDFCAPFMFAELEKAGVPVHMCFGNTDDRFMAAQITSTSKSLTLYGDMGEVNMDGKKIAFTHFPVYAFALASTGKYDVVFHGHTHKRREERVGKTLLINPGEIMGRAGEVSCAVYDTTTDKVKFISV